METSSASIGPCTCAVAARQNRWASEAKEICLDLWAFMVHHQAKTVPDPYKSLYSIRADRPKRTTLRLVFASSKHICPTVTSDRSGQISTTAQHTFNKNDALARLCVSPSARSADPDPTDSRTTEDHRSAVWWASITLFSLWHAFVGYDHRKARLVANGTCGTSVH